MAPDHVRIRSRVLLPQKLLTALSHQHGDRVIFHVVKEHIHFLKDHIDVLFRGNLHILQQVALHRQEDAAHKSRNRRNHKKRHHKGDAFRDVQSVEFVL